MNRKLLIRRLTLLSRIVTDLLCDPALSTTSLDVILQLDRASQWIQTIRATCVQDRQSYAIGLPGDCLLLVLGWFGPLEGLRHCSQVCRSWNQLTSSHRSLRLWWTRQNLLGTHVTDLVPVIEETGSAFRHQLDTYLAWDDLVQVQVDSHDRVQVVDKPTHRVSCVLPKVKRLEVGPPGTAERCMVFEDDEGLIWLYARNSQGVLPGSKDSLTHQEHYWYISNKPWTLSDRGSFLIASQDRISEYSLQPPHDLMQEIHLKRDLRIESSSFGRNMGMACAGGLVFLTLGLSTLVCFVLETHRIVCIQETLDLLTQWRFHNTWTILARVRMVMDDQRVLTCSLVGKHTGETSAQLVLRVCYPNRSGKHAL